MSHLRPLLLSTLGLALVAGGGALIAPSAQADDSASPNRVLSWPVATQWTGIGLGSNLPTGGFDLAFTLPPGLSWGDTKDWSGLDGNLNVGTMTLTGDDGFMTSGLTEARFSGEGWSAATPLAETAPRSGVYVFGRNAAELRTSTSFLQAVRDGTPPDPESFAVDLDFVDITQSGGTVVGSLGCLHRVVADKTRGLTSGADGAGLPVRVHLTPTGSSRCQGPSGLTAAQFEQSYLSPGLRIEPATFVDHGYGTYSFTVYAQTAGDYTINVGPGHGAGPQSVTLSFAQSSAPFVLSDFMSAMQALFQRLKTMLALLSLVFVGVAYVAS